MRIASLRSAFAIAVAVASASCHADGPVSRAVGARCDSSSECDDRCLPEGAGYPGGFCTLICNTSSECPSDAPCVDREGGVCLFECATDANCEFLGDGYQCKDEQLRENPAQKVKTCRGG
jgi:hypothetical protein